MVSSNKGLVLPLLLANNLLTSASEDKNELGTTSSIRCISAIPPASNLMHSADSEPRIIHVFFLGSLLIWEINLKPIT